jgi:uncharacterized protein (DUF2252 family)
MTVVDGRQRRSDARALRDDVPRSAHDVVPERPRDAVAIVTASNAGRQADLVPIRHARMAASSFAFYRGTAMVMNHDLAMTPATGITVQCCGDAHLSNFGMFATSERRLVFDINDFDETLPGPWEWDVKRLAASVHVAAVDNGANDALAGHAVAATAQAYRERMRSYRNAPTLDVWYDVLDVDASLQQAPPSRTKRRVERAAASARRHTTRLAAARLTERSSGTLRFRDDPPLFWRLPEDAPDREIVDAALSYRNTLASERAALLERFRYIDIARKVVGVGSVGQRCWVLLMQGPQGDSDVFVLQVKEAGPSVMEPHAGTSPYATNGQRVVSGQRLMQAAGDPFLGWTSDTHLALDGYVRQLWDMKGSLDVASMSQQSLRRYGRACAAVLARAHARTGRAPEIAGYLGAKPSFDNAIAAFARRYQKIVDADYASFIDALHEGRIEAARPGS